MRYVELINSEKSSILAIQQGIGNLFSDATVGVSPIIESGNTIAGLTETINTNRLGFYDSNIASNMTQPIQIAVFDDISQSLNDK